MGIIKQGILGAFSGKVGAVVGSSWKGIAVMKARPASVANPKTAGQVIQRNKMSNAVAFAQPILGEILKPLNDRFASRMSGYNLFIQRNIHLFGGPLSVYGKDITISPRVNKAQLVDALSFDSDRRVLKVEWVSDEGTGFALGNDIPFVVVSDETGDKVWGWRGFRIRHDNYSIGEVPEGVGVDDIAHIYLAFLRNDGTVVFATAYAKRSNVAVIDVEEDTDRELAETPVP